jgi:hypothetical protein
MGIWLCVSIAWVTFGLLLVGLGLLIVEHFSNTRQVKIADESISEAATQMAKLDRAIDGPVQRELAEACDALAQLEDTVTLVPRDAIPAAHRAVPDRTQRTGAVIIRDPRLTRARTLSGCGGAVEETVARTSATQEIGAISEAMEVLSAEMSYH